MEKNIKEETSALVTFSHGDAVSPPWPPYYFCPLSVQVGGELLYKKSVEMLNGHSWAGVVFLSGLILVKCENTIVVNILIAIYYGDFDIIFVPCRCRLSPGGTCRAQGRVFWEKLVSLVMLV